MFGWIRLIGALACMILCWIVLIPLQVLAMKTGWYSEGLMRTLWHRVNVRGFGLRIHRRGAMSEKRPLLIASNHVSWTDIEVFGSVHDVTFIAKSELAGWPLVGWLSKLQRTVYVERDRKRKSGEQANEIAQRLAAGDAMLLFAEGTTGDGNLLLPFKSTLFGAASLAIAGGETDTVYIQPAAIAYTRLHGMPMGRQHRPLISWVGDQDLAPHAKGLLMEGGMDVELVFGEPVEFSRGMNRKAVAREVEKRVQELFVSALSDPRPSR